MSDLSAEHYQKTVFKSDVGAFVAKGTMLPSGNDYCNITIWKDPPFLMGKLTISMAIFNSYVTNYQRVSGNHGLHHQLFLGGIVKPVTHVSSTSSGKIR